MIDCDVWVRGQQGASTRQIEGVSEDAAAWTELDVRALLEQMLIALDRARNPAGERAQVSLRGFSWIVSPEERGVLVHLEMQIGTVSAGPFRIDEPRLTEMIARIMNGPQASTLVH